MADITLLRKQSNAAFDRAHTLAMKLTSLLYMTWGESGEELRNMSDDAQDHYMWACSDMATELKAALCEMVDVENAIDQACARETATAITARTSGA